MSNSRITGQEALILSQVQILMKEADALLKSIDPDRQKAINELNTEDPSIGASVSWSLRVANELLDGLEEAEDESNFTVRYYYAVEVKVKADNARKAFEMADKSNTSVFAMNDTFNIDCFETEAIRSEVYDIDGHMTER